MRIRKIGKYGGTWVIKLSHYDVKDFNLKEDEDIDIEGALLTGRKKRKKNV
jgi:hypothetical protein